MGIQTQTYKKRLRKHSGLSKDARLVAIVIADLRYEAKVHSHEPLSIAMAELAAECGMHRNTLRRYLDECIQSHWILARAVVRDGRQQPNEYFVVDPTDAAEYRRMYSETARSGRILDTCVWTKSVVRLDSVLRSKNNGGDDARPQAVRGVTDEQDEQPQPANVPAATTAPAVAALQRATTAAPASHWLARFAYHTRRDINPNPRAMAAATRAHNAGHTPVDAIEAIDAAGHDIETLTAEQFIEALEQIPPPKIPDAVAAFNAKREAAAQRAATRPDEGWNTGWKNRFDETLQEQAARHEELNQLHLAR